MVVVMTVPTFGPELRARIAANLAGHHRLTLPIQDRRAAAVAVTVVPEASGEPNGTACFLLTRRAPRLRAHAGQWALPGGRVDVGEDAAGAALRELAEEVGLRVGDEHVLGYLLDLPGVPRVHYIPESERPVIAIPMVGTYVHAPTAAIVYQMREVAVHGRATRVAHFEQPVFAWR